MDAGGDRTSRLVARFGRHYAAYIRAAVIVPTCAIGLLRSPDAELALVTSALVGWSAFYAWYLLRREGTVAVAVDVAVLALLCASVPWIDAVEESNVGWIRLLVTFSCIAYQWHLSPLAGLGAVLVTAGPLTTAVVLADADGSVVASVLWIVAAAAFSRVVWQLIQRGAHTADRLATRTERAREAQQVAATVRLREQELANALHDTSATTLLMVGSGQVARDAPWLVPRARRDLELLVDFGDRVPPDAELVALLRVELSAVPFDRIDVRLPSTVALPFRVARTLADAAREALNNVVLHAHAGKVEVALTDDGDLVRIAISDDGVGFDVATSRSHGRGLRHCVRGRMADLGGVATISSSPAGTTVVLEWRRGV
ncbi:sensor histidine kinase [Tenggerimyces flavus]|uniref:Sensor histidine kinase n=1 Tax=Tenggerimyces flavus TaxID=1708749 RepID=A0ABV7Y9X9_9ACTN|nr:ATP-binding protein [Tenggerimyces flavus]MBM7785219.1 signal transduction histidine kinase [Tenggerimyces flavus]